MKGCSRPFRYDTTVTHGRSYTGIASRYAEAALYPELPDLEKLVMTAWEDTEAEHRHSLAVHEDDHGASVVCMISTKDIYQ
jgi:hypothetical protein